MKQLAIYKRAVRMLIADHLIIDGACPDCPHPRYCNEAKCDDRQRRYVLRLAKEQLQQEEERNG